jgi:hypothetical protein
MLQGVSKQVFPYYNSERLIALGLKISAVAAALSTASRFPAFPIELRLK